MERRRKNRFASKNGRGLVLSTKYTFSFISYDIYLCIVYKLFIGIILCIEKQIILRVLLGYHTVVVVSSIKLIIVPMAKIIQLSLQNHVRHHVIIIIG